jgi:ent-kaurene oxidase
MRDITLSDGTKLSSGTHIRVASHAMNMDPAFYPDPESFKGLRFYALRKQEGQKDLHQVSNGRVLSLKPG